MAEPSTNRDRGSDLWNAVWHRSTSERAAKRLEWERRCRRWTVFRDAVGSHFPARTLRAVELGCGEGDFSLLLAQLGHAVTLVDFTDLALQKARARFESLGITAEFVNADIFEFAERKQGAFDISCSLGTAEHFASQQRTRIIAAHAQLLRSGGLTLISVPNALCIPYRVSMAYLKLRGWWPYGYEEPFTAGEMAHRASAAGLKINLIYKTHFAASLDAFLEQFAGRERRGWGDGPPLANKLAGWNVNLLAEAP